MMVMPAARYGTMTAFNREGDDPFEQLFMAHYATVVAIASRVLADRHEAEDVAQEVFVSFHRKHTLDRQTPNGAPLDGVALDTPSAAAWLHAAAVHTALNVVRGRRRRARREEAEARDYDRLHAGSDTALDPQRAAEENEQRREIRAALRRLPAKSAAVLVLRYSGLSYAEVADALGVGVGQVGTLLRRAEAALRKETTRATP